MTTNLTPEIRAAALAVHEAEQRGDKTSQLLHGAVLADLVLQCGSEAHLNELADAMWAALASTPAANDNGAPCERCDSLGYSTVSPLEVAARLGLTLNAAQRSMSRAVRDGLVVRVRPGAYRLAEVANG